MKNIGILTYHSVCNFGANLQAMSTVGYFRRKGYNPIVIDWVPEDLERQYISTTPSVQFSEHENFVREYLPLSDRCRTEEDVIKQIRANDLEAVVIGSDAVTQHKSLWARFHFPTKGIFSISPPAPVQVTFPNPFWGSFADKLDPRIPIIMMSVSSQNEEYIGIQGNVRRQIHETLKAIAYISVRDHWTQQMFKHISRGEIVPPVTPDPVFSFNQNAGDVIASKQSLMDKFDIPEKYILLSFIKQNSVGRAWISDFIRILNHNKIECLMLPMPRGHIFEGFEGVRYLPLPLSPLDWYGLIKYSYAYVGHNMHPMIVSMHNNVPFYIFDYYGIVHLKYLVNSQSSKIYDILRKADMLGQRSRDAGLFCKPPKPEAVSESIINLLNDRSKQEVFSNAIQLDYEKMMGDIISVIENGGQG